jgi:uncharacterized protein YqjF (DUF2071 family)
MAMRWHDLLFMHWPVPAAALRPLIPPGLELQTFDGTVWLGVVPFRMTGIRHRLGPPMPWASAFAELNVRTYVATPGGGHPGVWFFSLDAANPLAVRVARWQFHLPYFDARMTCRADVSSGGWGGDRGKGGSTADPAAGDDVGVRYASVRTHRGAPPAEFVGRYRPAGPAVAARAGTLDHWLTERYCLYAADRRGVVRRGDIYHDPWPLRPAEAEVERNTMADPLGVRLPDVPPVLHFARRLDVVAWRLCAAT